MSRTRTLLISALNLVGGVAVTALIFSTEPPADRSGAVRESAMLVDVARVERGTFTPVVRAMGTVEASQDITVAARVEGDVVQMAPGFTPGGYVTRGDPLLRLDPADYRNTLAQRRSALQQAQSDLALERGRQDVARQDYELIGDSIRLEDRALVL
ncbi:MAG: efflux transporter periplasmic adaptor subunit, partial [Gemmatimonadota bacterium]